MVLVGVGMGLVGVLVGDGSVGMGVGVVLARDGIVGGRYPHPHSLSPWPAYHTMD